MGATLTCPKCNTPMNRHAAKIVEPRSAAEAQQVDDALGGSVAAVHSCPACGEMVSRRASPRL
jgi:endogenous inhibitor of DNA gyrase (YacG/DUF329 family)